MLIKNTTITFETIGTIHSPFKAKKSTPLQPFQSNSIGQVEVFDQYAEGLKDLIDFSHIMLTG